MNKHMTYAEYLEEVKNYRQGYQLYLEKQKDIDELNYRIIDAVKDMELTVYYNHRDAGGLVLVDPGHINYWIRILNGKEIPYSTSRKDEEDGNKKDELSKQ